MFYSIIIPIYNVEKYLEEAISSVLSQTFLDYELILVDDGSTDRCGEICDKYLTVDNRIKVIHKANGGLSDARNAGTMCAQGDYIVYLDSDDIMGRDALYSCYSNIISNNFPDLVIGNMIHFNDKNTFMKHEVCLDDLITDDIYHCVNSYILKYNYIPWSAYQNVYKRELLFNNNLFFRSGLVGAEDCEFFMRVIDYVKTFIVTDVVMVHYRMGREGSITATPKFNSVIGQLNVFKDNFVNSLQHDDYVRANFFADRFTNIILLVGYLNIEDAKECIDIINKNKIIFSYISKRSKYFIAIIIWKLFGYYLGSKILIDIRRR